MSTKRLDFRLGEGVAGCFGLTVSFFNNKYKYNGIPLRFKVCVDYIIFICINI